MTGSEDGFSILEMIVAMAVMLIVTAGVCALADPSRGSMTAQSEVADLQQRLRVAADALYKDLVMAGAGAFPGSNSGSLGYYFAPVLPFRSGSSGDDPIGTFRTDTITLISVPPTVAQSTVATFSPGPGSADIGVNADPGCPPGDPACGFGEGMKVLVYDATGAYDTFTITDVQSNRVHVERNGGNLTSTAYQPNTTKIVQFTDAVYYLKSDVSTGTYQLMYYDGGIGADVPVVDHLVALSFDYYGDPQPPTLTGTPLTDPVGPWTTYGPPPPALDRQIPTKGYPAGENCTFVVDALSHKQVPRLAVLGGETNTLVRLTSAQLTGGDGGPWCPDSTAANRWDANLLRIRKVGVTIRVETANTALRGPAGVLFARGGTAKLGNTWVPDQQMTFQVTPRNLTLGR